MLIELTYSERVALNELLLSYMSDSGREQTFFDYSVVPPVEVTSAQLLDRVAKAHGGRKPKRAK